VTRFIVGRFILRERFAKTETSGIWNFICDNSIFHFSDSWQREGDFPDCRGRFDWIFENVRHLTGASNCDLMREKKFP